MEDIQIKKVDDLFLIDNVKYRIPIYQRHYIWKKDNWIHLWNDVSEQVNKEKSHFTGVIVIREEGNTLQIVDGQQRLTTFQIILCAIRDICDQAGYQGMSSDVEYCILNESNQSEPANQYKLLPRARSNRDAFENLVLGQVNQSSGRIHDAYIYFKNAIKEYTAANKTKIQNLFNCFLQRIFVVEIRLKSEDRRAAEIFEGINGRGMALAQFDHLRNNIFLRAGDVRDRLYREHWQHFNNEAYWAKDSNDVVDLFLRDFLKAKLEPEFKNSSNLFDLYQWGYRKELWGNQKLNENPPELVTREFQELERYSNVYAEIANCSDPGDPIWFYQFLATKFETTSWHPLILLLKSEKDDLAISDADLKLTFRILESYIVRCRLCYDVDSIRRENHLIALIRERGFSVENIVRHLKDDDRIKSWPKDEQQVKRALSNAGNKNAALIQYILFKIELEVMRKSGYHDSELTNFKDLNREHVMPQSWKEAKGWKVDPKDYEKKFKRSECLQSIGNLTLLNSKANAELAKDYAFSKKKTIYHKYADLQITKEIIDSSDWDVDQIRERAGKMYERFCQVWPSAESFLFHQGVVNYINRDKKYGRIKPDDTNLGNHPSSGIYVCVTNFPKPNDINALKADQKVKFRITKTLGRKDIQAIDVTCI